MQVTRAQVVHSPTCVLFAASVELRAVGAEIRVNTSVNGYEFTLPGPDHYYMRLLEVELFGWLTLARPSSAAL